MKSCTYSVHAEKNGKRVVTIHKIHDNLPAAKKDAATLASMIPGAKGVVVKNGAARAVKRKIGARRNPEFDMEALGHKKAMGADPELREEIWRGITFTKAEDEIRDASYWDEVTYPTDKASVEAFMRGVNRALGKKPSARRVPPSEMESLGYSAAKNTDSMHRDSAWRNATDAHLREWIELLSSDYGVKYPTTKPAVAAFRRGVELALKMASKQNPGAARAVKRNTARKNPSDLDTALKVAAIISRKAGNKRGPIPKAGDPASIVRWLKWNDRDGDYRFLKYATNEEAEDQLVYTLINDDTEDWLKKGATVNPANPPREVVLGHVVVHTKQGYTIPAYKKVFAEMKEVRKWLKAHVAREREAKANPACRCKTKNNPKCRCKR